MNIYEKKLHESGISPDDAKLLGLEFLSAADTEKLGHQALASIKLNYFATDGVTLLKDCEGSDDYYRLRYLETPTASHFDAVLEKKRFPKYMQPKNTIPVAYFPKGFGIKWHDIVSNVKKRLVITEGEFKAAKACKHGFPTIGLGGVYSWRSKRRGIELIESLKNIDWCKREVVIVFDSDFNDNPQICTAINDLSAVLARRGAITKIGMLPHGAEKVGIDDFMVKQAGHENKSFEKILQYAQPLGMTEVLHNLNDRYILSINPLCVIDTKKEMILRTNDFGDIIEAKEQYLEHILTKEGKIAPKLSSAGKAWLTWPMRNQVDTIVYEPSKPNIYKDSNNLRYYNEFAGWKVKPVKGDTTLFTTLIDFLFQNHPKEIKEWFLCWLAYPLQHAGVKLGSSCLFHSPQTGTGKSMVGYSIGKIYCDAFSEIKQHDLTSTRNDWAVKKQFVMADDISGINNRHTIDRWNTMITQKYITIDIKYKPAYAIRDCINYYMTSNQPDALFISQYDRRFFVLNVGYERLDPKFYQVHYDKWLHSDKIGPALFHYFLNEVDTTNFRPNAHPPMTQDKINMIEDSQSELGGWVRQLQLFPESILKDSNRDIFSTVELIYMYDKLGNKNTTSNGLGRELARQGFRRANGGKPIRLSKTNVGRYYIVRNVEKWVGANHPKIVEHINQNVLANIVNY